jgi:peptidyl-prolyl cis-trans isomerase D
LARYLFPNGQFIGTDRYATFIASQFNLSVSDFENEVRQDIVIQRLQALITAGVTVGDKEVRDDYRKANIKIKFDYAVISSDDLRKTDQSLRRRDLEAFFKKNAARYASAVPEERKITYFAFTPNDAARRRSAAQPAGDSAVLQRTNPSTRFRSRQSRATS